MDKGWGYLAVAVTGFFCGFFICVILSSTVDRKYIERGWMTFGNNVYLVVPAKPVASAP